MMTAREWWTAARGPGRRWRTLDAWQDLEHADRRRIHARVKEGLGHPDSAVRARAQRVAEAVELAGWETSGPALSPHVALELEAAVRRGRALDPGERVAGCGCERCTGIPIPPARTATLPPLDDDRPPLPVEAARAVSILDVAARLGIEHKRAWCACPFHADSSPSMHLNAKKNAAFCNPCARSWDPIALYMEIRDVTFPDAVKELAANG